MPARPTAPPTHLFVCPSGNPLPRWSEAFPRLRCVRTDAGSGQGGTPGTLWLRLETGKPARPQVDALLAAFPGAPLIVLADVPDDDEAMTLFSAGVRAYCNAHSTAANLRQVAKVVEAGGLWIGESLMRRLLVATGRALAVTPVAGEAAPDPRLAALTGRELEVAKLIANGASNKEVARSLDITERTVKAHASSVFGKLGARDRLHLSLIVNGRDRRTDAPPREAKAPSRNAAKPQARVSESPAAGRARRETERWKG